jgi:transcription termination factor NusB
MIDKQKKTIKLSDNIIRKIKNSDKIFFNKNYNNYPGNINKQHKNIDNDLKIDEDQNLTNTYKKKIFFKKTFSRLILVQILYQIRFDILYFHKNIEYFDKNRIKKIITSVVDIDFIEWDKFDKKKFMNNFIESNIDYYIKNFNYIEEILKIYFEESNIAKNDVNDIIIISFLMEFCIFLENLENIDLIQSDSYIHFDHDKNIDELYDESDISLDYDLKELYKFLKINLVFFHKNNKILNNKVCSQKNILIKEYINVASEFSDDFFIKYINSALENIFFDLLFTINKISK